MEHDPKYCPQCGAALVLRLTGDRVRPTCRSCGFIYYLNPVVAAAALVEEQGKVALVRRGVAPRQGYWGLPAGYVEADETAEEAAVRETKEEAGLEIAVDQLLDVYSFGGDRDPRGVLIVYSGHVLAGELQAGDDASEAAFFSPESLPADNDIAFWTHRAALRDWRRARAVVCRPATEADERQAVELARSHQRPDWELAEGRRENDERLLVAMDREKVVGYAGLSVTADRSAKLEYVFVVPTYRRWGIGTQLLEECLDLARQAGATSLVAEVEAGNPAVAVYLKAGFRVCGFANAPAVQRNETALFVACNL